MLLVRPTAIAKRFVAAVEQHDYATAQSLLRGGNSFWVFADEPRTDVASIDHVYVEIVPREWKDVWSCRRRLLLRVARHDDSEGRHIEWTSDTEFVAHINGVEVIVFDELFGGP